MRWGEGFNRFVFMAGWRLAGSSTMQRGVARFPRRIETAQPRLAWLAACTVDELKGGL